MAKRVEKRRHTSDRHLLDLVVGVKMTLPLFVTRDGGIVARRATVTGDKAESR
jgi:hypothetical protein